MREDWQLKCREVSVSSKTDVADSEFREVKTRVELEAHRLMSKGLANSAVRKSHLHTVLFELQGSIAASRLIHSAFLERSCYGRQ